MVVLLKLTKIQDGRHLVELTRHQTIARDGGAIWTVSFDSGGVLWIVGGCTSGAGVTAYVFSDVTKQVYLGLLL